RHRDERLEQGDFSGFAKLAPVRVREGFALAGGLLENVGDTLVRRREALGLGKAGERPYRSQLLRDRRQSHRTEAQNRFDFVRRVAALTEVASQALDDEHLRLRIRIADLSLEYREGFVHQVVQGQ